MLAAVLVVAAHGCTEGDPYGTDGTDDTEVGTMDVNEARAEMDAFLTRTAEGLTATTGPVELVSDNGPGLCSSSTTGAVLDTVRLSLGYVVPVAPGTEREVLDEVIAAWEQEGLELDRSSLDRRDAQVRGRAPGASFGVRSLAVPDTGQVALTGETDCLDPGEE